MFMNQNTTATRRAPLYGCTALPVHTPLAWAETEKCALKFTGKPQGTGLLSCCSGNLLQQFPKLLLRASPLTCSCLHHRQPLEDSATLILHGKNTKSDSWDCCWFCANAKGHCSVQPCPGPDCHCGESEAGSAWELPSPSSSPRHHSLLTRSITQPTAQGIWGTWTQIVNRAVPEIHRGAGECFVSHKKRPGGDPLQMAICWTLSMGQTGCPGLIQQEAPPPCNTHTCTHAQLCGEQQ